MKDTIIEEAKKLNIDLIGFTNADIFYEARSAIEDRKNKGDLSPFLPLDVDKNTNPLKVWSEVKSIISLGISYKHSTPLDKDESNVAKIARVAWGQDYHIVLMDKMKDLMIAIQKKVPQLEYKAFTDSGFLLDRAIAERSGLGFYGKNGFIINPLYGSYIFLGHILINMHIEEDTKKMSSECGSCKRCITACPTGALQEGQGFDSKKCVSYLTQKKEFLNREERKSLGSNLYGCDMCQEVCPMNKKSLYSKQSDFAPKVSIVRPKLRDLLEMNNKTFKENYGSTAAGWRGKKNLQRNAIIVAGNLQNEENFQLLKDALKDKRQDIRLYAMLSLVEYGEKGKALVEKSLVLEDEEFKQNMLKAES